jgi:ketosteroid isomerase-like protein
MSDTVCATLVKAIGARDASAIAACFTQDAEFRALVPPGLRERTGATETASLFTAWFSDSTEFGVVDSRIDDVGGKVYVSYRLEGIEEGKPYMVEQHLYCTLRDGKISRADLLCSGFAPRPA